MLPTDTHLSFKMISPLSLQKVSGMNATRQDQDQDQDHEQEQEQSSRSSFSFESVEKAKIAVRCDAQRGKLLCYRPPSRAQSEFGQYLPTYLLVRSLSIIVIKRA
jgi:hypothetical protein